MCAIQYFFKVYNHLKDEYQNVTIHRRTYGSLVSQVELKKEKNTVRKNQQLCRLTR